MSCILISSLPSSDSTPWNLSWMVRQASASSDGHSHPPHDCLPKPYRPHMRNEPSSHQRKAKVGQAADRPSTPKWAQEFHEMKRRVSWSTALESSIENEPSPFPPVAPLQPPPPLPARRGSIVSAVLALAESPVPPCSTSPEGEYASAPADVRFGGCRLLSC